MFYKTDYNSPVGNITLGADGEHIVGLWIKGQKYFADTVKEKMFQNDDLPVFQKAKNWLDRYFVKGLTYRNQNEWRVIIAGEQGMLKANCGTGILLHTYPFQGSQLMKTTDFLNGKISVGD